VWFLPIVAVSFVGKPFESPPPIASRVATVIGPCCPKVPESERRGVSNGSTADVGGKRASWPTTETAGVALVHDRRRRSLGTDSHPGRFVVQVSAACPRPWRSQTLATISSANQWTGPRRAASAFSSGVPGATSTNIQGAHTKSVTPASAKRR
jgi:hypothetical protein